MFSQKRTPKRYSCDYSELLDQQNKRIATSKVRNTVRVQIFREKERDLRTSFNYILSIKSRETWYSDPGTGYKISKHSIASKTGIKASNNLILSTSILKMRLPERYLFLLN